MRSGVVPPSVVSRLVLRLVAVVSVALLAACAPASDEELESTEDAVAWRGPDSFALETRDPERLETGNAYWLARLSDIVYRSREEIDDQLARIGLGDAPRLFFENQKTHTQALYVSAPEAGILVFRGTEAGSLGDWLTDARAWRKSSPLGEVHAGFLGAFESIWIDSPDVTVNDRRGRGIRSMLKPRHWVGADPLGSRAVAPKPLFVTGHSLGGALATLATIYARYEGCFRAHPYAEEWEAMKRDAQDTMASMPCTKERIGVSALYTFGAPRVGDHLFNELAAFHLDGPGLFRFVNANDLVARMPDEGYIHPCRGRLETDGVVYLTSEGDLDVSGMSDEFKLDPVRASWGGKVGDHSIPRYVEKLLRHAGTTPAPRLSTRRAFIERVKEAYLGPDPPVLEPFDPWRLSGDAATAFARLTPNGGTTRVFVWRLESPVYIVRRDFEAPRKGPDGEALAGGSDVLVLEFFDAAFMPLMTAASYDGDGFTWTNAEDAPNRR